MWVLGGVGDSICMCCKAGGSGDDQWNHQSAWDGSRFQPGSTLFPVSISPSHSLKQSLQLHHTTCRNVHEINSVLSVLSFHNATGDIRPNGDRYIYHIQLSGITDSSISNCLGANICQVKINDSYRRKIGSSSKAKYYIKGEIKSISDHIRSYSVCDVRVQCAQIFQYAYWDRWEAKLGLFSTLLFIYLEILFITARKYQKFKIYIFLKV